MWKKLYDAAVKVQNDRTISPFIEAGGVAAAILTKQGNIYVGVCIDTASTLGMCAERNAIANMITNGESQIDKVVAVMPDGRVGSPCGACREYMMQLDKDSGEIDILLDLETEKAIKLKELIPDWWGKERFAEEYQYITLREKPELMNLSAEWFHSKWMVPTEAYLECMNAYLQNETEYGWYLCLDGDQIVGGLGVIENDFHDRKDLTPNICAVFTEEKYRCQGIAGRLLNMAVEDLKSKGISPVYLLTDHTGFYERYGWEFLCMVQGDGEPDMARMYIHR